MASANRIVRVPRALAVRSPWLFARLRLGHPVRKEGSGGRRWWASVVCPFVLLLWLSATEAHSTEKPVPDFGLMYNDDGDFAFTSSDPSRAMANLAAQVDALAGTPVRTLMYCVGSDVMNYPTRVGSVWGWRATPYETPGAERHSRQWAQRISNAKAVLGAELDPPRIAGQRAARLGIRFVPSYRMNDAHFRVDPVHHPFTSRFWLEHQPQATIGESPLPVDPSFGHLLDFTHPHVRAHRLAIITETIERYHDLMAGIELDFTRLPVLFPLGKADVGAGLVTQLVRDVRLRLNQLEQENGRPYYLFVRVPPSLEDCRWAGLDVATWMRTRLVDVVTPSQNMTLAHDMPLREFAELATDSGCRVYAGLMPRTAYRWPFVDRPGPGAYATPASHSATSDLLRGAAANSWAQGADGFQVFNFPHEDLGAVPYSDRVYRILRDLARPESLSVADAAYAVTPTAYLDGDASFQYRKQIPVDLVPRTPVTLRLSVEHPSLRDSRLQQPRRLLRLGLRGVRANDGLRILVNGEVVADGAAADALVAVTGEAPAPKPPYLEPPDAYFQIQWDPEEQQYGPEMVRIGVTLQRDADTPARLVSCELLLRFERWYEEMIYTP